MPALLKRMSRRPKALTVSSTARRHSAALRTSVRRKMACPPPFKICSITAWPRFSLRPVMATLAPSLANRTAVALPMPEVPPVISATLSCKRINLRDLRRPRRPVWAGERSSPDCAARKPLRSFAPPGRRGLLPLRGSGEASAIDHQRRAGYERRRITGQIQRGLRDLFRLAHPSQRPLCRIRQKFVVRLSQLLGLVAQHGSVGVAGANAVYANILRAVIDCHGLGQQDYGT